MPRLVQKAEPIAPPVWHAEPESRGVRSQPMKGGRPVEFGSERPCSRRGDVDSPARVVLAEARRGVDGQDLLDRLPRSELAPNDVGLVVDAAKARDEQQLHAGARCA